MALNTLEKIYLTLLNNAPRIELPEPLRLAALKPLQRMLEMSASVPIGLASATRVPSAARD
jgi:quinolinate synthase